MKRTYFWLATGALCLLFAYGLFATPSSPTGSAATASEKANNTVLAPPPAAGATTETASSEPTETKQRRWQQHQNQASYYHECASSPSNPCGFTQADPKAAFYQSTAALQQELQALAALAQQHPQLARDGRQIAHSNLQIPDRQVQLAALNLLGNLPAHNDNVPVLQTLLDHSPDPGVIQHTLSLLEPYQDQHSQIIDTIINVIEHGGHFAALAAARGLAPFVNDNNEARLQALQFQLAEDSAYRRTLERTLQQHRNPRS